MLPVNKPTVKQDRFRSFNDLRSDEVHFSSDFHLRDPNSHETTPIRDQQQKLSQEDVFFLFLFDMSVYLLLLL